MKLKDSIGKQHINFWLNYCPTYTEWQIYRLGSAYSYSNYTIVMLTVSEQAEWALLSGCNCWHAWFFLFLVSAA